MSRRRRALFVLLSLPLIAGAAVSRVSAAEPAGRVVVAVDRSAGLGLDGDAVRRAISAELHAPVLAPSDGAAAGAANIFVVGVDKGTIRMVLRSNNATATTGTIPASPDRAVRLREIGRLAANLIRARLEPPPPAPGPKQETTAAPKLAAAAAPGGGRSDAAPAPPVEAVAASGATPPGSPPPEWIGVAMGGPTMAFFAGATLAFAATYQIELQRRAAPGALAAGVTIQLGTSTVGYGRHVYGTAAGDYGAHAWGVGGFLGKERRGSRWFIDAAAGAGLEEAYTTSSGIIFGIIPIGGRRQTTPDLSMLLFVQGTSTAGVAVTSWLDLVGRLIVHLTPHGLETSFLGATAGVRLRLP